MKLYVGGALKNQRISFDYLSPAEGEGTEDCFVRDFATHDGYEMGEVNEGPFTKEAAEELAKLLNDRNKDATTEYRAVQDQAAAKKIHDEEAEHAADRRKCE